MMFPQECVWTATPALPKDDSCPKKASVKASSTPYCDERSETTWPSSPAGDCAAESTWFTKSADIVFDPCTDERLAEAAAVERAKLRADFDEDAPECADVANAYVRTSRISAARNT